jgi:two-component system sensor histidine kinase YesM
MGTLHNFKFRTQILVYFFVIIVVILYAVMQLLYIVLKNSYHDMERSILDSQARQIAMNIDYKIEYYQTYLEMLMKNSNLIHAAENDDFATVQRVLGYETGKFMALNKGHISKIQIYRNGVFTSKYYDIKKIFAQFKPGGPANKSNTYYTGTYLNDRNERVFSLFMKMYQSNSSREYLVELCFYETELFSLINKADSNYNVKVLNGDVLISTSERPQFVQSLYDNKEAYAGIPDKPGADKDFYHISARCNLGWNVVITVNDNYLDQNFLKLYMGLIPISLIVLAAAVLFATLISTQLNRRFSILHRKIDLISQWDLSKDLRMGGNDEFKQLSDALDNTKQRIIGLISQINDINEEKRSAEISALRAQINSHFLFNTLSSIKWLSRNDDRKAVGEAVDKLAFFLRYSLSLDEEQVLLRNEVEQLSAYIYFQKQRYHDDINIRIDIDDGLLECKTVKLILQPLVENAIYHGRKENGSLLNITIYTHSDEEYYYLIVEDDGNGMTEEKIRDVLNGETEEPKGSIGLRNVLERIRICSKGQAELTIGSKPGCYTKIMIRQKR